MGAVPDLKTVEKAVRLLGEGAREPGELCRELLSMPSVPEPLAEKLARTMLGPDPRFRRLPDGRWSLALGNTFPDSRPLSRTGFVVVDVETTGFRPPADRVIEIGMVRVDGMSIAGHYQSLINPRRPVPGPITSLTGISWSMVRDKPTFAQLYDEIVEFIGDRVFVAHNVPFDWRFIQSEVGLAGGARLLNRRLCTRMLARRLLPELERRSLDNLARFFNLGFDGGHRALGDAKVTARVLLNFLERAAERGIHTLGDMVRLAAPRGRRKAQN